MEFIENLEMIIALITGLAGLVGTAISTYFAIKNWVAGLKDKKSNEIWGLIMDVADKAMEEAEKTSLAGADKKTMAINIIQGSAEVAKLDIAPFMQQLSTYIDQTINFVNKMSNK
jgi:hypothetical protein